MAYKRMWEARGFGVFDGEINLESTANPLKKYFGMGHFNSFMVFRERKIETYFEVEHMQRESEQGAKVFGNDRKVEWLKKQEKKLTKYAQKMSDIFNPLELKKLSNSQLWKKMMEYADAHKETYGFYNISQPQCFEKFTAEIQSELEENYSNPQPIFLLLTTPNTPSFITREEIARKKMLIQFMSGKKKGPLIQAHLKNYRFIHATEGTFPWKEKDVDVFFTENTKTKAQLEKEINETRAYYRSIKKQQMALIREKNIPRHLVKKMEVLRYYGNARLEIRNDWSSMVWPYVDCMEEASIRTHVPYPGIGDYTINEMKELLLYGKKVSNAELKKRFHLAVLALTNGKARVLTGNEAEQFIDQHVPKVEKADIVKGSVASPGKVTGRVRIILFDKHLNQNMKDMKKGEILVAGQTRPILMPAIHKAAAIVTDEGGITSHAAIVSRELKIPCIIGTHNATRMFKDGDLVEVDAHKGTVKILHNDK